MPIVHSPPAPWPPRLVWFRTCDWRRRGGFVVIAPAPIHQWTWALYSASHLRRGQFLHLQTPLEKKLKEFAFLLHLRHNFLQVPTRPFAVISVSGWFLGFALRRRCRRLTWIFGRKLAVFVQSFDRLGSFVAPKAWEHKSPKPLEKRKPRWKSLQKVQLLQQRRTDR